MNRDRHDLALRILAAALWTMIGVFVIALAVIVAVSMGER